MPLSPRALCTVAEVKDFLNIPSDETGGDAVIERMVNAASRAIHRASGREFKPYGTNPQARLHDLDRGVVWDRLVPVGDMADLDDLAVQIEDEFGTVIQAYDDSWLLAFPRNRDPDYESITHLRIGTRAVLAEYQVLRVTGNYGFPNVPEDIVESAIETAALWYARDVQNFSATFSIDAQRVELPETLPRKVQDTIRSYRTVMVS